MKDKQQQNEKEESIFGLTPNVLQTKTTFFKRNRVPLNVPQSENEDDLSQDEATSNMPPLVGINRMNNDFMNHTMTTGIKYGYGLLNKKARDQSFYTEDKNK